MKKRKKAKKINDSEMNGDENYSNQSSSTYVKRDNLRDRLVAGGKWAEDLESTRYGGAGGS